MSFKDDGFFKVLPHGGGSSFGEIVENTSKLHTLERWKNYIDHPLFKKVLNNNVISELSNQIFGKVIEL